MSIHFQILCFVIKTSTYSTYHIEHTYKLWMTAFRACNFRRNFIDINGKLKLCVADNNLSADNLYRSRQSIIQKQYTIQTVDMLRI